MKHMACVVLVLVGCGGDQFSSETAITNDSDAAPNTSGGDDGGVQQSGGAGGSGASSVGGLGGSNDTDAGGHVSSGGVEPGGSGGASTGGTSSGGSGAASSGGSSGSGGGTSGECDVGAVQCIGNQRQTCVGEVWLDNGAPCPGWCLNGACTDCKPGERSCASDTQPRTCNSSGSWAFDAACSGTKPWCDNGSCFGLCCNAGAYQTYCSASDEPWHQVFSCYQGTPPVQTGNCANLDQCAVGSQCTTNAYSGIVARCL
jgi:hypothetical protein